MKLLLALTLLLPSIAMAKEYHFTIILKGDKLQYKTEASTWEEAYRRESQFCFDFFVKREGTSMNEDKGLDIIDACANPSEK